MDNKIIILLGSIVGDCIGSCFEIVNSKTDKPEEINLFNEKCKLTDDSILSFATLDALLHKRNFADSYWEFGNKYKGEKYKPGFGGMFKKWLEKPDKLPYNSFGNGSAMRVSPIPMLATSLTECLTLAKYSAFVTHSHEEGIKGAQCIAGATYLAWNGYTKEYIKFWIQNEFLYNLEFTLDGIRETYEFDETCQGSVPQAIVAFLESENYEDFLRLGISISGDTDTILSMGGCLAAAYYKEIPEKILNFVENKLPYEFKELINKAVKFMESNEFSNIMKN
jgi:ADP-ribosylglycohydrolase